MTMQYRKILTLAVSVFLTGHTAASSYDVISPNGKIVAEVVHDESDGALFYTVTCEGNGILEKSALGIVTEKVNFTFGLEFLQSRRSEIDETYTLPVGKVSQYVNKANQLRLTFQKDGRRLHVIFRVYNDGVAFRYAIPGQGDIKISGESTGFRLSGEPVYWGQGHPNRYGYENTLGKINEKSFSLPLLCELKKPRRWVLLSQAATYGSYCLPYLQNDSGMLRICFPINQKKPVIAELPFESPWRVVVVSPGDLSVIVEQMLFENLNPPTEPELRDADWIRPGSASWDWFAGDKRNTTGWVDFAAEMGWEYHLLDDGWEGYIGDRNALVEYADRKDVGIMVWKAVRGVKTPKSMHACFKKYAGHEFRGVKVDFFDRLGGRSKEDYEDTQMAMQVRDNLCRIAAEYKLQLVLHGAALPTGERRRWPHLLSTEAVKGQEGNPNPSHDNCIPYIRNPLGPVDYSPVWFGKGGKTDAYQLGTSVVFESGILLFADLHKDYLKHPAKPFLKHVPATWDGTKFVEGYPASHTVIARRKGVDWYVGGMTVKARTVSVPLTFLDKNRRYQATIYKDKKSGRGIIIESCRVKNSQSLELAMRDRGGFVVYLAPLDKPK